MVRQIFKTVHINFYHIKVTFSDKIDRTPTRTIERKNWLTMSTNCYIY